MHFICESSTLSEGSCKSFRAAQTQGFIVRKDQRVFGYSNSCPHLGIPLEWQADQFLDDEGELIQCATHGALFVIESGICVAGPCVNQSLESLTIVEQDNKIYLV